MPTDLTITAAAIATLVSSFTTTGITIWISRWNKKKNLDDQLDAILKIAIQYPYLESHEFISTWTANAGANDERFQRYETYGTLLFNFLHDKNMTRAPIISTCLVD